MNSRAIPLFRNRAVESETSPQFPVNRNFRQRHFSQNSSPRRYRLTFWRQSFEPEPEPVPVPEPELEPGPEPEPGLWDSNTTGLSCGLLCFAATAFWNQSGASENCCDTRFEIAQVNALASFALFSHNLTVSRSFDISCQPRSRKQQRWTTSSLTKESRSMMSCSSRATAQFSPLK